MSAKSANEYVSGDVSTVWHHLTLHQGNAPMIVSEGKGLYLKDINGKEYLDATSGGVWCVNVGYGRDRIADAAANQMKKLPFYAASCGSQPAIEFSEKLLSHMPGLSRVYISSSGSEANEKAFKMVRQISQLKHGGKKYKIIYRDRDYHGTTITTLSACGQEERRLQYGPFTPGFVEFPACLAYRSPYPEGTQNLGEKFARELEAVVLKEDPDTVGAVILEPITAGGGIIVPPDGYFETISEICKKYGLLLIIDEVVCGLGRTGTWFGYQHFNVKPDIVTMAKGVASAYMPISCTVTTEEVFAALQDNTDKLSYFRDISTFGGCLAAPAAALENIKIIEEEGLLDNIVAMGEYLQQGLQDLLSYSNVGDVRGRGLLQGIEFVTDKASKKPLEEEKVIAVCGAMAKRGVLVGRTNRSFVGRNNVVNLAPAYIVTKEQIDTILKALHESIVEVLG
ncbi:aminotransferase [Desulfovibrio sp. 86]|uniref:Taurine--pyruvate aminotransferase n=1 Tax=uncultured Desulfovibrio sp. TaxID=167968 RepID=A0A212L8R6_9BACT|nr:aminotransferase [Desulfovibrio sp. 86]SCM73877.1 Taurine--pyruvate aminotransferase [uncultured Desulfovibrio sp.]VZH34495.1 Taurine--pyruvate aminotransferase [Desulfovibrio sp. 86]